MMRDPKKQCIAKKCDKCHFYQFWTRENDKGEKKTELACSMQILFDEIPRIRGSVDGCQLGANEARNEAIKTKEVVRGFTDKAVKTIAGFAELKLIEAKR